HSLELAAARVVAVGGDDVGPEPEVVLVDCAEHLRGLLHGRRRPRAQTALDRRALGHVDTPSLELGPGPAVEEQTLPPGQALLDRGSHPRSLHLVTLGWRGGRPDCAPGPPRGLPHAGPAPCA